jgi:hypothetical protein
MGTRCSGSGLDHPVQAGTRLANLRCERCGRRFGRPHAPPCNAPSTDPSGCPRHSMRRPDLCRDGGPVDQPALPGARGIHLNPCRPAANPQARTRAHHLHHTVQPSGSNPGQLPGYGLKCPRIPACGACSRPVDRSLVTYVIAAILPRIGCPSYWQPSTNGRAPAQCPWPGNRRNTTYPQICFPNRAPPRPGRSRLARSQTQVRPLPAVMAGGGPRISCHSTSGTRLIQQCSGPPCQL